MDVITSIWEFSFHKYPNLLLFASTTAAAATILLFGRRSTVDGFPVKHGIPILGAWSFLEDREKFVQEGHRRFGNSFIFYLLNVCLMHYYTYFVLKKNAAA